jgi:ribosomal protein S27E
LVYEPGASSLTCPYCGAHTPIPKSSTVIERLDYATYANGLPANEAASERLTVRCKACGAETQLGANLTADSCVFCGAAVVAENQSHRLIKPQALLPFVVVKQKAQSDFQDWLRGLWFAPSDLLKAAECGKLVGAYIPHWTYDANARTNYAGERGEDYWETETYTEYVNGNPEIRTRQVLRTRWWPASGMVQNRFDDLLVLATSSLPPKQASHLQPWDLNHLVPYSDEYLAGFAAESYQVDLRHGLDAAKQIAEPAIRQTICGDIGGDHQRILSMQSEFFDVTFKHILLPLWISAFHYGGQSYRFVINARTGAVQGERPYSAIKIFFLVVAIILAIVIAVAISMSAR